jgi:CubicO group peptidase (beta-lactamase class C family)
MNSWTRSFIVVGLVIGASYASGLPAAQTRPVPASQSVGVSPERLGRLHDGMQAFVDRHDVGGIVTLLAREGKVVDLHASGYLDVESKTAMKTDSIFRIASMSKPITSVAVMMLYEEGRLLLTDPVSKFIPAFKSPVVMNADGTTMPARRGITIRDLLSHRSGITYGFLNNGPVGNAYRKEGVLDGLTVMPTSLAEAIDKLAAAPLMSQPGAAWNYSLSTDVLGRVVEVVSGKPFDVFLRERIFVPLGMTDTAFDVPDAKWGRLATVYAPDGAGGIRPMKDPESFGNAVFSPSASYKTGKRYFSGGAGLTSTASDYAKFCQMLLDGGSAGTTRLLSPKTVDLMTANHTADLGAVGGLLGAGTAFGLGFQITTDIAAAQTSGSNGLYGWSGIYGTVFWVDPKEKLVAIMMVQRYPGSPVAAAFRPLIYQALVR